MSEARLSNLSASNLLHSITNPTPSPNADVLPSHKQRATGSTHFGDGDWDEERPEDIQDATWGEVWQVCCVHSANDWGRIFIGACVALFFLYMFLVSIELLGSAAKVLTGCSAGGLFGSESNPIAGFVIGMLVTVLIQSSSTTTSIIVSLVGAHAISVQYGIYMVMGANVGTSVTNT
jgi:sodium-dependent phosphate cotransporter